MAATAAHVRAARSFLRQRRLMPPLSPRLLATAADELQKSFAETVKFIMDLRQGSQNQEAQQRQIIQAAANAG
jgi:hypothetical protein